MGQAFEVVQREYFGRGLLNLEAAWHGWTNALSGFADALPETQVYYGLEVVAVVGAAIACVWAFRRWPAASVFGLGDARDLAGQWRAPGNGAVRPRGAADLPRTFAPWRRARVRSRLDDRERHAHGIPRRDLQRRLLGCLNRVGVSGVSVCRWTDHARSWPPCWLRCSPLAARGPSRPLRPRRQPPDLRWRPCRRSRPIRGASPSISPRSRRSPTITMEPASPGPPATTRPSTMPPRPCATWGLRSRRPRSSSPASPSCRVPRSRSVVRASAGLTSSTR